MKRYLGKVNKKLLASLGIGGSAFLATAAMAQTTIDVTAPLAVIAAVVAAAVLIGTAYLGMVFGIRAYKWLKGAA